MSPGSGLCLPRWAVNGAGLLPLAGTSQSRLRLLPAPWHEARMTAEFHHRDGNSGSLVPGTGSTRITPP